MLGIIILATLIISAVSLIGILFIANKQIKTKISVKSFISLAAGSLLAVSFLDLLPEAINEGTLEASTILALTLASIIFFFLLERTFHWHHCRCKEDNNQKQSIIVNNLIGDGLHNLIDGFLVASAFLLDFKLGMITTGAVILHEIPQEIADFSVLIYGGYSKKKALIYNLLFALTAVVGAILFYYFGQAIEKAIPIMAAFAAGNFIYLAAADLIPELHHEKNKKDIIKHTAWLLIGVSIFSILAIFHHHG